MQNYQSDVKTNATGSINLHFPSFYHNVLFCDNVEYKCALPFIMDGLAKKETVIYISDEDDIEAMRQNYQLGLFQGLSLVDSEDWYMENRKLNKVKLLRQWMEALHQAFKEGYKGLRIMGGTSFFFRNNLVDQLMSYERALPKIFGIPITAICRYKISDILSFDKSYLPELLKIHNTIIIRATKIDFLERAHNAQISYPELNANPYL